MQLIFLLVKKYLCVLLGKNIKLNKKQWFSSLWLKMFEI